jgi:hypothetical protein
LSILQKRLDNVPDEIITSRTVDDNPNIESAKIPDQKKAIAACYDQSFANIQAWVPIPTDSEILVQFVDAIIWEYEKTENEIILDAVSYIEIIKEYYKNCIKSQVRH